MAARYKASIGEVLDDAMMLFSWGSRALFLFRDLLLLVWDTCRMTIFQPYPFLTPSICRSIHHIPGTPNIDHKAAFFPSTPIGSHCRMRK